MAIHRIHHDLDGALSPNQTIEIEGDEAKHAARTKRLAEGDPVELLTGRGLVATARITAVRKGKAGWALTLGVDDVRTEPRTTPEIHLRSGVPKGPRLEGLIDGVSQGGAASWGPLETRRSVVDPRPGKLARMERIAAEAAKQCGRAWMLEVLASQALTDILAAPGNLVIADADAPPYEPTGAASLTLLVGPEGGFEPEELERAVSAGARSASFGPHVMRIETACTVACAVILDAERRLRPQGR